MDIFLFFHFDLGDIPVQHVEYEENPYGGSWVYLGVNYAIKMCILLTLAQKLG